MPWLVRMTLIVVTALAIVYGYELWKLSNSVALLSGWSRALIRTLGAGLIFWLNLYPLLLLFAWATGGPGFLRWWRDTPRWLDYAVAYPFWIGLLVAVELLPWFLLSDAIKLPLLALFKRHRPLWLLHESRFVLAALLLVGVYVTFRALWDTRRIRTQTHTVHVSGVASGLDGLRIVHISDIQADPHTGPAKLQRYIEAVNSLDADLVIFTGDLVTSGTKYAGLGARMLAQIRSRRGVYATLGDHDFWAGADAIRTSLRRAGVRIEENGHQVLDLNGQKVLLTTVTEIYSQRLTGRDLKRMAQSKPAADLAILISHQPSRRLLEFADASGYHLFLAGHTHGGQIVFRPFGLLRLSPTMIETRYFSGVHRLGGVTLSVNNGLGFTFAPIRYHAPAEVTLLRVRPGEPDPS